MSLGPAIGVALTFVWLGMVLAISFLEAPLKFRAPGVTLQIGLGIGRLVFRALNSVEVLLAVGILIALALDRAPAGVIVVSAVAFASLVAQLFGRATAVGAPLRRGVGRSGCPSLACSLRVCRARGGQGDRLGGWRDSPTIRLNDVHRR